MRSFTKALSSLLTVLLALLLFAGAAAFAVETEEAAKIADTICGLAAEKEKEITPLLQSMENDSRKLIGLEYRLKTPESTARKLLLNAHDMEISLEEAADTVKDALRYTFCLADEAYTDGVDEILKVLDERGFTFDKVKNYWGSEGYKGINTNPVTPDGFVFEIQFHTQDSYDAKEVKTHALYEIVRSEESSEAEKEEASAKQLEIFATVPVPEGAADYVWSGSQSRKGQDSNG